MISIENERIIERQGEMKLQRIKILYRETARKKVQREDAARILISALVIRFSKIKRIYECIPFK